MQNEDEELRDLEEKLGRLKPRGMDESYADELTESLDRERNELTERRNDESYPSNVLWVRFAPVAAAAGVVLLGTFFLRYESQMGDMQAQRNDLTPASGGMAFAGKGNVGAGAGGLNPPASQLESLPVPRLGVGENYGAVPALQGASSLLPVSAQNYLSSADRVFGDPYQNSAQVSGGLHFEDAYDWHGAEAHRAEVKDQQPDAEIQGAKAKTQ
ncbi:MAG: hypothetical protein GXP30_04605 [Verrucomicrobia bacterium]|nr:hypothetical protein [Verrucomicrobiota bacterium]